MKQTGKFWIYGLLTLILFFGACRAKPLQDGTFKGVSSVDEQGSYGEILITVKGKKITDCRYLTRQRDGTIKDKNYGKLSGTTDGSDFYKKAQRAVGAMSEYAEQLVQKGAPQEVDIISGATISYKQFQAAAKDALRKSREVSEK